MVGRPESIAEQIKTKVLDAGVDGVIINLPFYTPGIIEAAGEALRPLVHVDGPGRVESRIGHAAVILPCSSVYLCRDGAAQKQRAGTP